MTRSARRTAAVVLGLAVVAVLLVSYLVRDTRGYAVRESDGTYQGDITHYIYWTRLVTLGGVQDAYGGTWPETYAVYPPITLYAYQALGNVYRATVDPTFDMGRAQHGEWLPRAIKATAVLWHLATGAAIFAVVRRTTPTLAAVAAAAYLVNPAALFDTAHWAQPDGAHSLFTVLAIGSLRLGWPLLGWAAIALAALAKPQAWAVGPLFLLASWRQYGFARLVVGAAVALATAGVVLLPFLLTGRLAEFLSLPAHISTVMPVVTGNAHNVWWLVLQARQVDPLLSDDSMRLLGPLTYRLAALLLVGLQFLLTYWLYWTRRAGLAEAAALGALGWFTLTTQAHENHLFFALPLLSLAWPERRSLLVPFAILSLTVLLNMALHDELLLEALGLNQGWLLVQVLRNVNATLNVLTFVGWSGAAARRRPVAEMPDVEPVLMSSAPPVRVVAT